MMETTGGGSFRVDAETGELVREGGTRPAPPRRPAPNAEGLEPKVIQDKPPAGRRRGKE